MNSTETHTNPNHPTFKKLASLIKAETNILNSKNIPTDNSFFSIEQLFVNEMRLEHIRVQKENILAQCN